MDTKSVVVSVAAAACAAGCWWYAARTPPQCGNVKATVTLQQAATPSPESWSTADTTSATTRFHRISVAFTAE